MREKRLFRWVGSKAHYLKHPLLNQMIGYLKGRPNAKLISPFYGSGVLEQTIASQVENKQIAAEAVPELISLYLTLKEERGSDLASLVDLMDARRLRAAQHNDLAWTASCYNSIREQTAHTHVSRATRFIWLNTFSFRGLWRVNADGQMNTPPDNQRLLKLRHPLVDMAAVGFAAKGIRRTGFLLDWKGALAQASAGDLILADPPYLGVYESYTAQGFSLMDHQDLEAELAAKVKAGCAVVAFNSWAALSLYKPWGKMIDLSAEVHLRRYQRAEKMADGESRAKVSELVIIAVPDGSKKGKGNNDTRAA